MARMIAFAVAFASFATGGFADKVPDQAEDECGDACLAKNSLLQVKKSKGGDSDQADLEAQRYEEYAKSNYSALSDDQKAEVDELHELAGGACLHGNDIKRWNEWGGKYQFQGKLSHCGHKCAAGWGCTKSCMQREAGYSSGCASCMASLVGCSRDHCTSKCIIHESSWNCQHCVYQHCRGQMKGCSGLDAGGRR
eukprot:TRINITY_DN14948_c0_g1_i2.p1 TRINITY_DN14948_c0_g1~~TRINITY_DN14948_c0_g1_i2.p1  ORF type:complete len:195 (+),score=41.81 TRINITY_DN14948_c0_g1_i2:457-1041(+)